MQDHATNLMLSRLADGELRPEEMAALDRHISACPACRRRMLRYETIGAELCEFYRAPVEGLAPVRRLPRAARRPSRLPAVAVAAAVAGIMLGYPAVASEMRMPSAAQSGIAPQAVGIQSPVSRSLPARAKMQGFVVAAGHGELSVRVDGTVWKVVLPPGVSSAAYPSGLAVEVYGLKVGTGHLEALQVVPIQP